MHLLRPRRRLSSHKKDEAYDYVQRMEARMHLHMEITRAEMIGWIRAVETIVCNERFTLPRHERFLQDCLTQVNVYHNNDTLYKL